MSEFFAESWTNNIDQMIKPGDKVLAIASGYGYNVNVRTATFLGVRKNVKGIVNGVSVEYLTPANKWRTNEVGMKSTLPLKRVYRLAE